MCNGPESPPMNSRLRSMSALSSARSNSPKSTTRPPSGPSNRRASAAIRAAAARSDGPELRTIRRHGDAPASAETSRVNAASGQRRNGLPALTWITTSSCADVMPQSSSRSATRASAWASPAICTASRAGSGSPCGQPSIASSKSHWFRTECLARSVRGRATVFVYIHVRPVIS